jgi:hypothetical protein
VRREILSVPRFAKNTTVMSDDVIQSLSKDVDDSLYSRWNDKNFIVDYKDWYKSKFKLDFQLLR